MMKEFHPDLFVDFYDCNDHMCVTINKIDCLDGDHRSKAKKSGTYRSNIKNYLQLLISYCRPHNKGQHSHQL